MSNVMKSGSLNLLGASGPHWASYGPPLPVNWSSLEFVSWGISQAGRPEIVAGFLPGGIFLHRRHLGYYWMATCGFLRSRQQPRRETDYSRQSSVKVKNEWSYFSTTPYAFIACRGTALALTVFTATSLSAPNWDRRVVETRWTENFGSF